MHFKLIGSMRYDVSQAIKNMDDVLLYGRTLEEVKTKLETFLDFCKEKNLKLKPSKMNIGEEVEMGTHKAPPPVSNRVKPYKSIYTSYNKIKLTSLYLIQQ